MSLSVDDLRNLVLECRMGMSPDQIRQRVEAMETKDLEVICDGQSFEIFYNFFEFCIIFETFTRTYIFTQKRSEIVAQRRDHSGQKKRPLQKLHIHASTRGYIVLMTGMWPGITNDAAILKAELAKSNLSSFFNPITII